MRSKLLGLALLATLSSATAQAQQAPPWQSHPGAIEQASYAADPLAPEGHDGSCTASCTDGAAGCDECCEEDCCEPCWQWRPRGLFVEFEYNMWWTKSRSLPPLATTSPVGTPLIDVGVLPAATVLFGGDDVGGGLGQGGRLTFGKWLDSYQTTALAARFTAFRADDASFSAFSDGTSNLALPFIDALSGDESSFIVGFTPDGTTVLSQGSINIEDRLDLTGVEVFGNFLVYDEGGARFDFFGGYHMLRLDNNLSIGSNINAFGDNIVTTDLFDTENEFHGGFIGVMATMACDKWFFNVSGKMSVGNMNQRVEIDGNTVVTTGPIVDVRDEGLFALGTNQGRVSNDRMVYIPEANLKLGYRVRDNVALTLGYNFLYINSVAMSGDQVDRTLNVTQLNGGTLIGPARPQFLGINETDFWAQGINFGVEVAF